MNYSIMAHGVAKYGLGALKVGAFMGSCFLSYGFGLMRGERRVTDENRWKKEINVEKWQGGETLTQCAHPH